MIDATIIIAAWCAEDRLERSVRSALAQTGVTVEVIVVDDASTDGTLSAAEALAASDSRVRVLSRRVNGGPAAVRNMAIEAARGRWIAVLDSDDAMTPERLVRLIALGEARGADAVYDDFQPVDDRGAPVGPSHLATRTKSGPEGWDLQTFLAGCQAEPGQPSLGYLKPVLNASFLRRTGLRYDETLRNGEDFHLMAELLARGGALWVSPELGYLYTTRTGSISNRLNPDHARALTRADTAFLVRNGSAVDPDAAALMRRRQKRLGDLGTAEIVLASLRTGQPATALRALLARPRAVGRLLRQSWAAARRRLR